MDVSEARRVVDGEGLAYAGLPSVSLQPGTTTTTTTTTAKKKKEPPSSANPYRKFLKRAMQSYQTQPSAANTSHGGRGIAKSSSASMHEPPRQHGTVAQSDLGARIRPRKKGKDAPSRAAAEKKKSTRGRRKRRQFVDKRDLRYFFLRTLIAKQAYYLKAVYSREKGKQLTKVITQISLLPLSKPLYTVQDLSDIPGVGAHWLSVVQSEYAKFANKMHHDIFRPPQEKPFLCSAPAMLVALLLVEEDALEHCLTGDYTLRGEDVIVPVEEMVRRAQPLCEEAFQPPTSTATSSVTSCNALRRIDALVSIGFVKARQWKRRQSYSLTAAGRAGVKSMNMFGQYEDSLLGALALHAHVKALLPSPTPQRLRTGSAMNPPLAPHSHTHSPSVSVQARRHEHGSPSQIPATSFNTPRNTSTSRTSTPSLSLDASFNSSFSSPPTPEMRNLYCTDDGRQQGIIMIVDTREGGNKSHLKRAMSAEIGRRGLVFKYECLKLGDYSWIQRHAGRREEQIPILVERKRLDDLSDSFQDGRFRSQCTRMKALRQDNPELELHYLIEGKYADYQVKTCCAKGCISRHGGATVAAIEKAKEDLQRENFIVHHVPTHMCSVDVLEKIHRRLHRERVLLESYGIRVDAATGGKAPPRRDVGMRDGPSSSSSSSSARIESTSKSEVDGLPSYSTIMCDDPNESAHDVICDDESVLFLDSSTTGGMAFNDSDLMCLAKPYSFAPLKLDLDIACDENDAAADEHDQRYVKKDEPERDAWRNATSCNPKKRPKWPTQPSPEDSTGNGAVILLDSSDDEGDHHACST